MICKVCKSENLGLKNNGPHKELYCKDCGMHQKFLSSHDANKFLGIEEKPMRQSDLETHPIDYYNGVAVDIHNNVFGLISMNKGANDVWYKRWIFWSEYKNGKSVPKNDKVRPLAIRLGDKAVALEVLKKLMDDIQRIT